MTRRILERFTLNEISAVDRPAQAHAKVSLIKRADTPKETDMQKTTEPTFDTFEAAVAHLEAIGMTKHEAHRHAGRSFPSLLAKYQGGADTSDLIDTDAIEKARADNKAIQKRIDAAVATVMTKGMTRLDALKQVRRSNPELFAA